MSTRTLKQWLIAGSIPIAALGVAPVTVHAAHEVEGMHVASHRDVRFVSGGIGKQEQQAMHERAKDFDLMLTFARRKDGSYLSNVQVDITDMRGHHVLTTTMNGPILLADLPNGEYLIHARLADWTPYVRHVKIVHSKRPHEIFVTLRPTMAQKMQHAMMKAQPNRS